MKNSSIEAYVKALAVGTALFCQTHASAQSSLIGTLPMQFNPAFAGAAGNPRIGASSYFVSYKARPSSIDSLKYNSQTFAFSYDNFIPKFGLGIGVHGSYIKRNDEAGLGSQTDKKQDLMLGLSIAPKFSFKGKYTLSPAVEINANLKNTNYDHFSQKLEPVNSSVNPEVRLGLAFNGRKFYMGAAYHIDGTFGNERGGRSHGMYGDVVTSTSPRWYIQMGYNTQRIDDSKFAFSPQIVYGRYKVHVDEGFRNYENIKANVLVNLTFRYKQLIWGVTYDESYDGSKLMVGWQNKNFRIAYLHSGEFTSSSFNGQISFRYIFNTKKASDVNKNISY